MVPHPFINHLVGTTSVPFWLLKSTLPKAFCGVPYNSLLLFHQSYCSLIGRMIPHNSFLFLPVHQIILTLILAQIRSCHDCCLVVNENVKTFPPQIMRRRPLGLLSILIGFSTPFPVVVLLLPSYQTYCLIVYPFSLLPFS